MSKKETWIKSRHKWIYAIGVPIVSFVMRRRYTMKLDKLDTKSRPHFILMNHQTPMDQFFIAMATNTPIYFVATEDIFSLGFLSKVLKFLVNPIPIKKSGQDLRAVRNCMRIAKEGGSICLFPEGNRTFSGKTETMKPAVVKLVKALKLPVAFFNVSGGSIVDPRWSSTVRPGELKVSLKRVLEYDEYSNISEDELFEVIKTELYVDDTHLEFKSKIEENAENLERLIYTCPNCGLSEFETKKDKLICKKCGQTHIYTEDHKLIGDGFTSKFEYIKDWYAFQEDFVLNYDFSPYLDKPIYEDKVSLSEVILYDRKKELAEDAKVSIYCDRIEFNYGNTCISRKFDTIQALSVMGRNKVSLYADDIILQIKGSTSFNAVKYVNIYYANIKGDINNDKFLGL